MNWVKIFNRLFEIINTDGETYFSGSRFINKVREIDPYFANYNQYIGQRNNDGKSTSRKDYFYDILLSFDDQGRLRLINSILDDIHSVAPEKITQLRGEMIGLTPTSTPSIPLEIWNAERLNKYIQEIDTRIANQNFSGAITLAYTCLEGFLKAFVKKNTPDTECKNEITALAKNVQSYLKKGFPIIQMKHLACLIILLIQPTKQETNLVSHISIWSPTVGLLSLFVI